MTSTAADDVGEPSPELMLGLSALERMQVRRVYKHATFRIGGKPDPRIASLSGLEREISAFKVGVGSAIFMVMAPLSAATIMVLEPVLNLGSATGLSTLVALVLFSAAFYAFRYRGLRKYVTRGRQGP